MTEISNIRWQPGEAYADCALGRFLAFCEVADMPALHAKTAADPAWFWDAAIRFLDVQFYEPYTQVLDMSGGIQHPKWCLNAKTNLVLNCLDKHCGTPVWDLSLIHS